MMARVPSGTDGELDYLRNALQCVQFDLTEQATYSAPASADDAAHSRQVGLTGAVPALSPLVVR